MSVQIARSGKVFHSVESIEELREEIRAGRVLPTDHFHMSGMSDWRLVSTLPEPPLPNELTQQPIATDPDALVEHRRAQIRDLIEQPDNPKPDKCRRCGTPTLKSSKLVWQQSTRVGGAIDSSFDFTVFGSSTLQGLEVAPPAEPKVPGVHSGKFLTTVVAGLILFLLTGCINMIVLGLVYLFDDQPGGWDLGVFGPILFATYIIGVFYIGFLAARKFHRWDSRRGLIGVCEVEFAKARAHLDWRNTWICTSCGAKTIARGEA